MTLIDSFKICVLKKYADFNGKACRSEYWWFWLIYWLLLIGTPMLAFALSDLTNGEPIYSLMLVWALGVAGLTCPFVAVSLRRLHDAGLSGWHFYWRFIPYIGFVITFFLMIKKSEIITEKMNSQSAVTSKNIITGIALKKVGMTLLIILIASIGCCTLLYIPFYLVLGVYYIHLVWKKEPYSEGDFLMLPVLHKIGLLQDISNKYLLKKKILIFFTLILGTILMSIITLFIIMGDNENVAFILLIISVIAWTVYFYYEFSVKWLNKEE